MEQYWELWQEMKSGKRYQNLIYELIKRYQPDFEDSEDTIVIIDKIQESTDIYNRIWEFTRTLKCDFIFSGVARILAAYVILGINMDGKKEVLTIQVGDNESLKYWLSVLKDLKNRGVKDILIICADGLSGIKEVITAAYPQIGYQRCIVHQVRNALKYVADKDRKPFAADLKTIYHASNEEKALEALESHGQMVPKYFYSMKR